jgi:hypothetical protein
MILSLKKHSKPLKRRARALLISCKPLVDYDIKIPFNSWVKRES